MSIPHRQKVTILNEKRSPYRSSSLLRNTTSPSIVSKPHSSTPTSLATRLQQKRVSIDRKIELQRKKKLEDEMKEVQQKPNISSRSRQLALKAEKKLTELNQNFTEQTENNSQKRIKKSLKSQKILTRNFEKISVESSEKRLPGAKEVEKKSERIVRRRPGVECIEGIKEINFELGDDIVGIEENIKDLEKCLNIKTAVNRILDLSDIDNPSVSPGTRLSKCSKANKRLNFERKFHLHSKKT